MQKQNSKQPVKCPKCGTDVMETGFTIEGRWSETYMRFGSEPAKIATAHNAADCVFCLCCRTRLDKTLSDLMRAA